MRLPLAYGVVVALTSLLASDRSLQAQSYPSGFSITCPPLSELEGQQHREEEEPPGPRIVVSDIVLSGASGVSPSEQRKILVAIQQQVSGYSVDAVTDEVVERVRAAWQDRGYFEASVNGKARLVERHRSAERISVIVHVVSEGPQYRLSEITFKNNTKITDLALLRSVFPITDGDIFSREKIAVGLETLRKTYGRLGYLNFVTVPDTSIDSEAGLIALVIDMDEGKQFYLSTIEIVGLDDRTRQEVLKNAPIGQIYDPELLNRFLDKYVSVFKLRPDDPRLKTIQMNFATGAVSITLYACPCSIC